MDLIIKDVFLNDIDVHGESLTDILRTLDIHGLKNHKTKHVRSLFSMYENDPDQILKIIKHLHGQITLSAEEKSQADITNDDRIGINDIVALQKRVADEHNDTPRQTPTLTSSSTPTPTPTSTPTSTPTPTPTPTYTPTTTTSPTLTITPTDTEYDNVLTMNTSGIFVHRTTSVNDTRNLGGFTIVLSGDVTENIESEKLPYDHSVEYDSDNTCTVISAVYDDENGKDISNQMIIEFKGGIDDPLFLYFDSRFMVSDQFGEQIVT